MIFILIYNLQFFTSEADSSSEGGPLPCLKDSLITLSLKQQIFKNIGSL